MTKHTHSSLQIYLTGLGTATLLATTSNAAVVMMDLSSISGANGGVTSGTIKQVTLGSLTDGRFQGNISIWNKPGSAATDGFGLSFGDGGGTSTKVLFASPGGKTSPQIFGTGATIDSVVRFEDAAGSASLFSYGADNTAASLSEGSYMGFKVSNEFTAHYGWLEVTWDADTKIFHILSGAYESQANMGIIAGIPEPSSLALLAAGAAGVAFLRRRKKAA